MQFRVNKITVITLLVMVILAGCRQHLAKLRLSGKNGIVEIDNGRIKARFALKNNLVTQEYYAYKDNDADRQDYAEIRSLPVIAGVLLVKNYRQ